MVIKVGKEEVKLSSQTTLIVYVENPKHYKLSEFSKVFRCKIKTEKPTVFLHTIRGWKLTLPNSKIYYTLCHQAYMLLAKEQIYRTKN